MTWKSPLFASVMLAMVTLAGCGSDAPPPTMMLGPDGMPIEVQPIEGAPVEGIAPFDGPLKNKFGTWPDASGPAGGFAIRMPPTPNDELRTQPLAVGEVVIHTFSSASEDAPKAAFFVTTYDYPAGLVAQFGPERFIRKTADGFYLQGGGRVKFEKDIKIDGLPAIHFVTETPAGAATLTTVGRVVARRDRVLVAFASSTDASVAEWGSGWLDSLRFF